MKKQKIEIQKNGDGTFKNTKLQLQHEHTYMNFDGIIIEAEGNDNGEYTREI